MVEGSLKVLGPDKLRLLIENDWYLIENIFYGIYNVPVEGYKKVNLSPEDVQKAEQVRMSLAKVVLPVLGMTKLVASKFPVNTVEMKVTPEWLIKRGEKRFPEIVEVWKETGEKGRMWLEKQSREIVNYLTGRTVYSPQLGRMASVEELKLAIKEATLQQRRD